MQTLVTYDTLTAMTALQRLTVSADEWQLKASVELPASLTRLNIDDRQTEEMPVQVKNTCSGGNQYAATVLLWTKAIDGHATHCS
jgi:hypothetical protein